MGGSFNPAHFGHLNMSLYAKKYLHCHEIWWVPTIGNPLKNNAKLAPFATRLAQCRQLTQKYPYIRVQPFEQTQQIHHTIDVMDYCQDQYNHDFIILMGADCYHQLHQWVAYQHIIAQWPIAVFMRRPFAHFYQKPIIYNQCHLWPADANIPPWWHIAPHIYRIPNHLWAISSTQIRNTK